MLSLETPESLSLDLYLQGQYKLSKADIGPESRAIKDAVWQRVRLSMKGKSTERKLYLLALYLERRMRLARELDSEELAKDVSVQVQNYVNALKRGGQLSKSGEIQK